MFFLTPSSLLFGSRFDHNEYCQLSKALEVLPKESHMARCPPSTKLQTSLVPPPPPASPSVGLDSNAKQMPSSELIPCAPNYEDTPDTPDVLPALRYCTDNISVLELDPQHPDPVPAEKGVEAATYAAHAKCNHSHRSMTLALFTPTHVSIGAVGYYSKSTGKFITLFNAFHSFELPSGRLIPSLHSYGNVKLQYMQHCSKTNQFAVPLTAGEKAAHAFTKSSVYAHIDNLAVATEWLKDHIDIIMEECGSDFHIKREDLSIVTGTINAQDYALFLSQDHPEGLMFFNIYDKRVAGSPWGEFSMTYLNDLQDSSARVNFTAKVSKVRYEDKRKGCVGCGDTLVLARLRIRPGAKEPTLA